MTQGFEKDPPQDWAWKEIRSHTAASALVAWVLNPEAVFCIVFKDSPMGSAFKSSRGNQSMMDHWVKTLSQTG